MKKGLSRVRMRLSVVMIVISLALILFGSVKSGWTFTLVGAAALLVSVAVRPWGCPTCGKKVSPRPQWSEPGKYHCPYCGNRLFYNDEEEPV